MNIELSLERCTQLREDLSYSALLVQGDHPATWLATVCALGLPTSTLSFLPLCPDSANPASMMGQPFAALVFGPTLHNFTASQVQLWNSTLEHANDCSGESVILPLQAYYNLAGRLFLPSDSVLTPPLHEAELRPLLPTDSNSKLVWHPAVGLIEFEASQVLSTTDLLSSVDVSPSRWNAAKQGATLNSFIASIRPELEIDGTMLEIIQGPEQDDLDPFTKIKLAPRAPDEVNFASARDAIRAVGLGFLGIFAGIAKLFSRQSSNSENNALQESPNQISHKRENELKRLLHLLEKDPENGLKYAIPFGGNQGRGIAPPSSALSERSTNFDLNQIGYSGRVDQWDLPQEYQFALLGRYRELAQRAMRLGQHRQAAYIYAKLLGDLHSAASALESGRHYVDAAALYMKHLHQPLKAANCFRSAGLWEDCVVIYRDQKQWLDAGDVYMKLDDTEQGHAMYRRALAECEQKKDFFAAADIAENKLNDIDEAVRLLKAGWSYNHLALESLRKLFQLNSRHSRHGHTLKFIEQLSNDSSLTIHQSGVALNAFSQATTDYPDADVRRSALAQCWQLASRVLSASKSPPNETMEAIRRLAPSDQLLSHDTFRYAASLKEKQPRQYTRSAKKLTGKIVQAAKTIPKSTPVIHWSKACMSTGALFLLGTSQENAQYANRITIDARHELQNPTRSILTLATGESLEHVGLIPHPTNRYSAFIQSIPGTQDWNESAARWIRHDYLALLPPHPELLLSLAFQAGTEIGWALRLAENGITRLDTIRTNGLVQSSTMLPSMLEYEDDVTRTKMVPVNGQLIILTNGRIYPILLQDLRASTLNLSNNVIPMPSTARVSGAAVSPTNSKIVIPIEDGLFSLTPFNGETSRFADSLYDPFLCGTASGAYVACCRNTGLIQSYRANQNGIKLIAESSLDTLGCSPDDILGFYSAHWRNHFLIVTHQGTIFQLKIETDS